MRSLLTIAAIAAAATLAPAAEAQEFLPLSFEIRGGGTIPVGDFADLGDWEQAQSGFAFGASAAVRMIPMVAVYAGYSEHGFDCQRCREGGQMRSSGLDAGIRVDVPGIGFFDPWLRGGATFHTLRIERSDLLLALEPGADTATSDRGTGLELGGGLNIALIPGLTATPGIRWNTYPAEFTGALSTRRDVSYVLLDVGLRLAF